jgi:hypothetical protein
MVIHAAFETAVHEQLLAAAATSNRSRTAGGRHV